MKRSIPFILFAVIAVNIPDEEIRIVENDVVSAEQWLKDAWAGKVSKCRERIIKAEVDHSVKAGEKLPGGTDAIVKKHFSRPAYKNRKQRDAELSKKK